MDLTVRVCCVPSGNAHIDSPPKDLGRLWAWGRNEVGQLGLGHRDDVKTPTLVQTSVEMTELFFGDNCVFALDSTSEHTCIHD